MKRDVDLATFSNFLYFQLQEHSNYLPKRISVVAVLFSNALEDTYMNQMIDVNTNKLV